MVRFGAVVFAAALGAASGAGADPQIFNGPDFQFEDGSALTDLRTAYETHGTLAPGRDNAILLLHGTSGDRHAFDAVIGPGKTFDTNKYFIITLDAIGGGDSSSPSDEMGQDFPRYTIRDMVAAQYGLVTRQLGIPRLAVVAGSAMGAFAALEWGIHHPEAVKSLILLEPMPKTEANFRLSVDLMASVIALDPEWQGGRYSHNPVEGLRHAGMVYYPWLVSAAYLDRLAAKDLAQELEDTARRFAEWDANALVWRYAASRAHDVSAPFHGDMKAALAKVIAPTLILPSASDRLFGLEGARRIRDGIRHAVYAEIPGDRGHSAARAIPGTPEWDFIDRHIRTFLQGPPQ